MILSLAARARTDAPATETAEATARYAVAVASMVSGPSTVRSPGMVMVAIWMTTLTAMIQFKVLLVAGIARWSTQFTNWHRSGLSNGPTAAINNLIYRIRALLYAGRPNWALLDTLTPARIR